MFKERQKKTSTLPELALLCQKQIHSLPNTYVNMEVLQRSTDDFIPSKDLQLMYFS